MSAATYMHILPIAVFLITGVALSDDHIYRHTGLSDHIYRRTGLSDHIYRRTGLSDYIILYKHTNLSDCVYRHTGLSDHVLTCRYTGLSSQISCSSPAALTVQFNPATYSENEGDQVVFMLELSVAVDRDVTVDFTTVDGSATGIMIVLLLL